MRRIVDTLCVWQSSNLHIVCKKTCETITSNCNLVFDLVFINNKRLHTTYPKYILKCFNLFLLTSDDEPLVSKSKSNNEESEYKIDEEIGIQIEI